MTKIIISRPSGTAEVNLTAEEELQRTEDVNTYATFKQAAIDAKAQEATDKINGNQKLLDLGLSQAEVDAITK